MKMPTYRITGPDGGSYEVTAPEGATQEQVLAYAQQNAQQAPRKSKSAGQPGPWTQYQTPGGVEGQPIEVDLHGGQVAEFPAGTSREVMEQALQAHHRESQIDVSQVQWDDEPQGAPAGGINPNDVQWDDAPITDLPGVTSRPDFSGVTKTVDSTEGSPADYAPDGWKYGAGRDAAFSVRSALQGAGGLLGAIGGDAFNHYIVDPARRALHTPTMSELITGQGVAPTPSYRDSAAALADRMNLPKAQTAGDRIKGDMGEALTGTGLTLGLGGLLNTGRTVISSAVPTVRSRLAELLTAQPKLQVVSTATGTGAAAATREGGGGAGAQTLAGLFGGLSPAAATSGGAATLRGLMRGASGETMQDNIAAFRATGATPSVGQAAGNRRLQGAESLLAGAPTSTRVMGKFAEQQADSIGSGLRAQADRLFPNASAERAGRAVERGVDTASKNISATRKALYWNVDRLIPATTTVPMTRTQQTLAALTTPTPGAKATSGSLINPRIAQLADDLATDLKAGGGAGIPYEAVKSIRSRIGEELSDFALSADRPTAQYKRLYAALSQDMEDAARQRGPEAMQAVRRANAYFRASAERLEQLERVVDRNGGPEKIYNAVMSGTKDGGTTLRAVMQSLPKEGQRAITGAVIKRMGLANPGMQDAAGGAFSSQTFLTNWNNVSAEAKRALFDRHGQQFAASMDQVAQVAENIRSGSRVFANPSGTANRAAAYGYAISLLGSLGTGQVGTFGGLAAGGVGANVLARAFTNPAFVNWLARSTTVPIGALPAQLQTVRQLAEAQGDESVVEVANALEARLQAQGDSLRGNSGPRRGNPLIRAADGR
ncbi:MAG: hypothetical protein ACREO7_03105 [Pseudoxanthomonas sp.]